MESVFKKGDVVVDEDYIPDLGDREGIVEEVCDGFCFIRWRNDPDGDYFSTTNFEWISKKEDRLKELEDIGYYK